MKLDLLTMSHKPRPTASKNDPPPLYFKRCNKVLYADDATLTHESGPNIEIIQQEISSDVHFMHLNGAWLTT